MLTVLISCLVRLRNASSKVGIYKKRIIIVDTVLIVWTYNINNFPLI